MNFLLVFIVSFLFKIVRIIHKIYRLFCMQATAMTARMPPMDEPTRFTVNWYPQSGFSPFLFGIGRMAYQILLKTERMAFILKPVLFRLRERRATAANPTAPMTSAFPPLYVIQSSTRKRNRKVAELPVQNLVVHFFLQDKQKRCLV